MNKLLLFILFLVLALFTNAQLNPYTTCYTKGFTKKESEKLIFTKLEIEVSFKGWQTGWRDFVKINISFSNIRKNLLNNTTNFIDSVTVRFVINKQKEMSNLEIIQANLKSIEEEAMRLFKLSSCYWKPGENGSRYVNAYHKETLYFIIDKSGGKLFKGFRIKGLMPIYKVD